MIEFADGMHEYVTTPVRRALRVTSNGAEDVWYVETVNSRYRMEVRQSERLDDAQNG